MDVPWLDLPFTFLTLLLATRLAYDHYGVIGATYAGCLDLQIFLFYCFFRWYRRIVDVRATSQPQQENADTPPVLTPLIESDGRVSLNNTCFGVVFFVFVPLIIVVFEQSQADVWAYMLCVLNNIVLIIWLSPDHQCTAAATESLLRLMSDDDSSSKGGSSEDKCCVCLSGMREEQMLRELPGCKHRFHDDCIEKWLKSHLTCPVCRSTVEPAETDEPLDAAFGLV